MKKMKRFATASAAMILALSMVAATSSFAAFAEEGATTHSITVSTTGDNTFKVYQLLTGDFESDSDGNTVIVKAAKGSSLNTTNQAASVTVDSLLEAFSDTDTDASTYVDSTNPIATLSKTSTNVTGLATGYYLVIESKPDGSQTKNILKIVDEDITITSKLGEATFEKKLKDTDDTAGTTTDWQDSADYDIGDSVPFQLKATLPENVSSYEGYYVKFTDNIDTTFSDVTISKVYIKDGETEIEISEASDDDATGYTYDTSEDIEGKLTFTVSIPDVKRLGATNNSQVIVEYSATLTENAVIGSAGNWNEADLTYSNNPEFDMYGDVDLTDDNDDNDTPDEDDTPNDGYDEEDNTNKTEEDKVVVFTYKTVINKVDQDGAALAGAKFTLYKKVNNAEDVEIAYVEVDNNETTTFTFTGLDDGTYVLKETDTPDGYNTIDDITFKIAATHDVTSDDPELKSLTGNKEDGTTFLTVAAAEDGDSDAVKAEKAGTLTADVENNKGTILPTTGGIGTKLFYVGGGALVLASGVLLVTKKRMKNSEE